MNNHPVNDFKIELAKILEISVAELERQGKLEKLPAWDSLAVVSIMAMMSQYFNKNVRGKEIESCQTLADLMVLSGQESDNFSGNIIPLPKQQPV